jgi:hypothetical protein
LAPKGEVAGLNELIPNADAGFVGGSVEGLGGADDDDDEKKSGTWAVEPKADFAGLEVAVGVVLGVGSEKPDIVEVVPSTVGVNPPLAGEAIVLDGAGTLPKPTKVEGGAGMAAGGLGVELLEVEADDPSPAKTDVGVGWGEGLATAFGLSSKSFCTDMRKFL